MGLGLAITGAPIGPGAGGASYSNKVLAIPNCIGYWPLTETSGAVATELSGNAANGTAYGVTWADAAGPGANMGRAPSFDGLNDYIDIFSAALAANVDSDGALTISLWCKHPAGTWTQDQARVQVDLFKSATERAGIWKGAAATGYDLLVLYTSGATASAFDTTSTNWIHLAGVFNGTSVTLWADGIAKTPAAYTGTSYTITAAAIGRYGSGGYFAWGHIGHVALFARALSEAEIITLATAV